SGFPIGAVIGKEYLKEYFGPGSHGSTFGGNPLAVAAATATMKIIFSEPFLQEVRKKGEFFHGQLESSLKGIEIVKDIRGLGMMLGIELDAPISKILKQLRTKGLLALSAGNNVLRLLPPLTATKEELQKGVEIISAVLKEQ